MFVLKKSLYINSYINPDPTFVPEWRRSVLRLPSWFTKLKVKKFGFAGRSNKGKITIQHRGGCGMLTQFRVVNFNYYIQHIRAFILTSEYDPNRTAPLSLLSQLNSVICYILSIQGVLISSVCLLGLFVYDTAKIVRAQLIKPGFRTVLKSLKTGIVVHNIETRPLRGAKITRVAGAHAKIVSLTKSVSILKLKSKILLRINNNCGVTVGMVSQFIPLRRNKITAGAVRRLGRRPSVRGVAKNPIDHPHGGGEGKTSGGRPSVTPTSNITKGNKTARKIKYGAFTLKR